MHIETDTISRRHRHFFAAPVALAVLVAAVALTRIENPPAVAALFPTVITAHGGDRVWNLPNGLSGVLREDAAIASDGAVTELLRGTALVRSTLDLSLWVGEWQLRTFDGGFMVIRSDEDFTLLALTSPVLLRRADDRFIVPAGMMLEISKGELERISDDLLLEQRSALRDISVTEPEVRLPEQLQLLGTVIAGGHNDFAHRVLLDETVRQELLAHGPPTSLLRGTSALPSVLRELAQYIQDTDLWLLLTLHEQYRLPLSDSIGPLTLAQNIRDLRWLAFPLSDTTAEAAPALAVKEWSEHVQKSIATRADAKTFTIDLFSALQLFRSIAEPRGWSERLAGYAEAVEGIAKAAGGILDHDSAAELVAWRAIDDILPLPEELPPLPTVEPPVPLQAETEPQPTVSAVLNPIEAQALIQRARDIFHQAGALFVPSTTLEATAPQTVKITNLIFATQTGEHSFTFTLDVAKEHVSGIQKNGQTFPLGLPLQRFIEWAKK